MRLWGRFRISTKIAVTLSAILIVHWSSIGIAAWSLSLPLTVSQTQFTDQQITIFQFTLLASGLLLFIVVLAAWWGLSRTVIRPLRTLTEDANQVAQGDYEREMTAVDNSDEIGALARSLREMKQQLIDSIDKTRQFRDAIEHAGHSIFITDPNGIIQYVNPEFETTSGYSAEEAIGRDASILNSDVHDREYFAHLWETITNGEVWEGEVVNQRKNGELYYIEQTIAPITNEEGEITHYVAINTEITERKAHEQQRQVLNRVLRHNLRNQLNIVDGYAQQIVEAPDESVIRKRVRRMRSSVGDLLTLSEKSTRAESIFQNIETANPRIVCPIVKHECESLQQQYPDAAITIDVPSTNWAVETKIEAALREILENAIEHNDQSDREVTVTVEADTPRTDWVSIEVADNGPGIPQSEREVLEHGQETPLLHGSGVGLWIVHWITLLGGGEVTITDREPRGTSVTLALPGTPLDPNDENDDEMVVTPPLNEETPKQ